MILLAALLVFTAAAIFGVLAIRPWLGWLGCAAGGVLLVVAGARAMTGHTQVLGLGTLGALGHASLRVDSLSGMFLVITFAVSVPVLAAGATPSAARRPRLVAVVALCLAAIEVIITADHLFVLLFGWETVTIAFYLLAVFDRHEPGRPRAAVATVTFGKASGAALLVGGLLLAAHTHTFTIESLGVGVSSATHDVAYALLLFGFGIKIGLVPVQVWLPPSYAAAPGPARAVMAGVAVNVGCYGMWRTLDVLGAPPMWLVVTVLIVGGITAILGIAHAAVHPDLAGLIAWSSVENAGVITVGFGTALVGAASGIPQLTAAGLLAGTAQLCAHALGKSLLFVSAGVVEQAAGTTDLDLLRGVTRRLPWAGAGLVVGAFTLAGLPLTAGFASEWLTLEALMQQFRVHSLPMQLATAAAGALVALTIGVASVTFVRLVGLTAFGHPPVAARRQDDRPLGNRLGIGVLAAACLGVAAIAPLEMRFIAAGLRPLAGPATQGALRSPWVLQPVFTGFSALSPSWLWIAIPVLAGASLAFAFAVSGRRLLRVRSVPAWSSASPGVDRGVGYTSFGYANPMRKVLANLLLTRGELHRRAVHPNTADEAPLHYRVDVVEVVERYLYRPLGVALMAVVRTAKRLQSGRLDAYLTYMLIALVAVLAVVAATA